MRKHLCTSAPHRVISWGRPYLELANSGPKADNVVDADAGLCVQDLLIDSEGIHAHKSLLNWRGRARARCVQQPPPPLKQA